MCPHVSISISIALVQAFVISCLDQYNCSQTTLCTTSREVLTIFLSELVIRWCYANKQPWGDYRMHVYNYYCFTFFLFS